tara:strand:- start:3155 stop:5101 length:1947 start_codon:yes stop_codon:yes gene_type:complete
MIINLDITMLDKLRNSINSIFSKLFLLVLAASFALWGVGDIFSPEQDPKLAEVGHLEVTANEFITTYQRILSELNSNTNGNFTEEMAHSLGLPNQTLNQLINEKVYDIEVEKANIILPDKHLRKLIISTPAFKDQFGRFNQEQFKYVLRQLGMDEKKYFDQISKSILRDQVRNIINPHNDITNIIGDTYYKIRNEERSIETVNFSSTSFKSDIKPSNKEIEDELINNIEKYEVPEYRSFSIMTLKPADLIPLIKINEDDIKNEYNNYPEKFNHPEKRELYLANFSSEEEAINIANTIKENINLDKTIEAKSIFIDIITNKTDKSKESISLGNVQYADLPNEVAESVFKSQTNKLIGPEKTVFGWRIYIVSSIEKEIILSFQEVKNKIEKELKVAVALEQMYELGNIFYDELAMGNNIIESASAINAKVKEISHINNLGKTINDTVLRDLPPYPELIETVFLTNEGNTSDIINTISNIMYAVQVNEIIPARTKTIEEAREEIIKNINNNNKLILAKKSANIFYDEYKSGISFQELVNKNNLLVIESANIKRDGTGSEGVVNPSAIEEIFSLKASEITQPILYNNSYTISKILYINPSNNIINDDVNTTNSGIINVMSEDIHEIFINYFSNKQNIKINNILLDSLFSNNS